MKQKGRLAAWLVAAALCLGLFLPTPALAADLYFTSINDSVTHLTADTMPVWSGGILYVPYTVFDPSTNTIRVDLGLTATYSRSSNTVSLYTLGKILTFDLNSGTCRDDMTGEIYLARAIMRNGRPYLPLVTVCNFFGLGYSYNAISQGYLVRIKNSAAVLDDAKFIDAAGDLINRRLREYNQSLAPAPDPTPSNPGVVTPPPDVKDDPVSPADVRTYLAFRCEDGEGVSAVLDALDSGGFYALFLFTPQVLEQKEDLVRRILGTGHSVGLLAEGASPEETRALLEQGLSLLEQTAHVRTTVACVPKEQRLQLEGEGWVCWDETMALSPSESVGPNTFASSTLKRLSGRTASTYLTMEGDGNTARVLSSLTRHLNNNHFLISIPMETRL